MPPGSLARLIDVLVEVLGLGQLGDTRLGLLVGHLGSSWGEVLVTLDRRMSVIRTLEHKHDLHAII